MSIWQWVLAGLIVLFLSAMVLIITAGHPGEGEDDDGARL